MFRRPIGCRNTPWVAKAPVSVAAVAPPSAVAVLIRATFLVLCHGGVVLRLGVRRCRAAVVAHGRSGACLVLVPARRLVAARQGS